MALFVVFSCNCGQARPHVNYAPEITVETPLDLHSMGSKSLSDYTQARTVGVYIDCTVKKGAAVVGMSRKKANKLYDTRGTGIIIRSRSEISYILTAYHVVKNDWPAALDCVISIKGPPVGKKAAPAKILTKNGKKDIAIISVKKNLKVSTNFNTDPYLGMPVYSVGYTGLLGVRTKGKISMSKGVMATIGVVLQPKSGKVNRVTSQLFFGNSGGGVWSADGRLLGVAVMLVGAQPHNQQAPTMPYEGNYYIKPSGQIVKIINANKNVREQIFGK